MAVDSCCSSRAAARVYRNAAAQCDELAVGESHWSGPNVEHWHGGTPDSEFRQVALSRGDASETVWLDKVTDDEYGGR